jgi:hypothetical protein
VARRIDDGHRYGVLVGPDRKSFQSYAVHHRLDVEHVLTQ